MNVIGVFGFGMNPGACLLVDGRLVAFAEEERFTRIKAAPDLFPGRSIAFCLARAGLSLDDVDRIAFAWDTGKYPYKMFAALARQYVKYRRKAARSTGDSNLVAAVMNLLKFTPGRLREEIRLGLRAQGLRGTCPPVDFVPHHLCHSYSAYFCSPFDDAVVLTFDGSGEETCTQVAVGSGEDLTVAGTIPIPHSLGWYYAAFTAYLGFLPYRHEGKLMGLAGLGAGRAAENPWPDRLSRVLRVHDGSYEVDPTFTRFGGHSHADRFTDALVELLTGFDPELGPVAPGERSGSNGSEQARYLDSRYVDLAWGVQRKLEEAAGAVARRAADEHATRNLCIAGGVGLNCKMNGALLFDTPFDNLFVQPACYDAGAAIGAAMVVAQAAGDRVRNSMQHAYWGPAFSNDVIRGLLDDCKVSYETCDDVAARAAEELAAGKLVGWFQGSMELGARALGARSILASPARPGVKDALNREVKSREPWRPFCPSILAEEAHDFLVGSIDSPFMNVAFPVEPSRRGEMAAAMHVDGTARPQTVRSTASPLFHRLISEFRGHTGLPYVINTSFNVDGEPIVCTPREALRCFYSSGLDVLAMGDFILSKR